MKVVILSMVVIFVEFGKTLLFSDFDCRLVLWTIPYCLR